MLRAIGGDPQTVPACGGLPLGLPTSIGYQSGSITLGPGDTLLASTDGLPEAMSATREFFGPERIARALCESRINGLAAVRTNMVARLDEHLAGAPIADDVTILLLRRTRGLARRPRPGAHERSASAAPCTVQRPPPWRNIRR